MKDKKTRKQYAMLNSVSSLVIYFFKLFFQFVNRSIVIAILGIRILGITNLVTSVIGVLGLAELGVGTAITYALYKPIAEGDIAKRNAYLELYRKVYKYIAIAILLLGATFFPFIKFFTSENIYSYEFYSIYVLLLINASIGYMMFAYKRSLLEANQQKYLFLIYDFIIYAVFSVIRWVLLYYTGSYALFLVLNIVATILSNLVISYIVDKNNDIKSEIGEITHEEKEGIKKNILGGFTNQLAGVIVFSTDNLLISKFLGIVEVGLYGNYVLITSNLNIIIQQLTNSHTSTIGNLIATESSEKVESVFKKYNFMNYAIVYFCSLMTLKLVSPFVKFWLGEKFILDDKIVYLMVVYFFINSYRHCYFVFTGGYGLYWAQKKKAIVEAIANIVFSVSLLTIFDFGMSGILLGTILSNILVNVWYEPLIIYKYGFKKSIMSFFKLYIKQIIVFVISFIILLNINFNISYIYEFVLYGIIYAIITIFILSIFYFKSEEYKYVVNFVMGIFSKLKKKVSR